MLSTRYSTSQYICGHRLEAGYSCRLYTTDITSSLPAKQLDMDGVHGSPQPQPTMHPYHSYSHHCCVVSNICRSNSRLVWSRSHHCLRKDDRASAVLFDSSPSKTLTSEVVPAASSSSFIVDSAALICITWSQKVPTSDLLRTRLRPSYTGKTGIRSSETFQKAWVIRAGHDIGACAGGRLTW